MKCSYVSSLLLFLNLSLDIGSTFTNISKQPYDNISKQPYGPLMCEKLCGGRTRSCIYKASDLSCNVAADPKTGPPAEMTTAAGSADRTSAIVVGLPAPFPTSPERKLPRAGNTIWLCQSKRLVMYMYIGNEEVMGIFDKKVIKRKLTANEKYCKTKII